MKLCPLLALGAVAFLAASCDRIAPQPSNAPAHTEQAAPSPALPDLMAHVGQAYPAFVAEAGVWFSPEAMGLNAADRAHLWRLMADARPAVLVEGGGAAALVLRGCAAEGCLAGEAIVALDTATGAAFVAVRDGAGVEELIPNDRLGALLRLRSPNGIWSPQADGPA